MLHRNNGLPVDAMSGFEPFSSYTQQFTAAASRANRLALENAESMFGVQLKTFEKNITAATGFWGELAQSRDVGNLKTLLPKGLQVARDNLERAASAHREVAGISLKATEALGELMRDPFAQGKQDRKAS